MKVVYSTASRPDDCTIEVVFDVKKKSVSAQDPSLNGRLESWFDKT